MRLALTSLILCFASLNAACSSSAPSFSEKLDIAMLGSFQAPPDARGNSEPQSITFTLKGVTMTLSDGTVLNLYADNDAKEFKIISRSQIIFESNLSTYVGKEGSAIAVIFDKAIKGTGKLPTELATNLTDATPIYSTTFTVQKAKTLRLEIQVQWKNIVNYKPDADPPTETLEAPTLVLDLKND